MNKTITRFFLCSNCRKVTEHFVFYTKVGNVDQYDSCKCIECLPVHHRIEVRQALSIINKIV